MKFQHKKLASVLALAGLLSACGGDNGSIDGIKSTDGGNTAANLVQTSGKVTDEAGVSIPGISVLLENRITDKTIEAITDADGNFNAQVSPGVYDIIFDDKGKDNYVSMQKTVINMLADIKLDARMMTTQGLASNSFTGTVKNLDGTLATSRQIIILPSIARSKAKFGPANVPDPTILKTDAQGNFSTLLGKPGMDFGFDAFLLDPNAPEFNIGKLKEDYQASSDEEKTKNQEDFEKYLNTYAKESVDIEKPNGAMHIEIQIGSPTHNLRSTTGAPSAIVTDAVLLENYDDSGNAALSMASAWTSIKKNAAAAFMEIIPSAYAGQVIRKFLFVPGEPKANGHISHGDFINGQINPSEGKCERSSLYFLTEKPENLVGKMAVAASKIQFCVLKEKSLLIYNYKLNLMAKESGAFIFTDKDGDSYSLRVRNTTYSHTLKYNNPNPAIVSIEYDTY